MRNIFKRAEPVYDDCGDVIPRDEQATVYWLSYDEHDASYALVVRTVRKSMIPREAVHVTGEKDAWFVDCVNGFVSDPSGPSAIDLQLWLTNNSINNALAYDWRSKKPMDLQKLLTYAVAAIFLLFIIYIII